VRTAAPLVGTADLAPRINRYVGAAFAHHMLRLRTGAHSGYRLIHHDDMPRMLARK
jgi:hypothetical protein